MIATEEGGQINTIIVTERQYGSSILPKNMSVNGTYLVPEWVHDIFAKRAGVLRVILVSIKTREYCGA